MDNYDVAGDNSSLESYETDPIIITEIHMLSHVLKVAKMKLEPGNTILGPKLLIAATYMPISWSALNYI